MKQLVRSNSSCRFKMVHEHTQNWLSLDPVVSQINPFVNRTLIFKNLIKLINLTNLFTQSHLVLKIYVHSRLKDRMRSS
jgi:hypothetical protein